MMLQISIVWKSSLVDRAAGFAQFAASPSLAVIILILAFHPSRALRSWTGNVPSPVSVLSGRVVVRGPLIDLDPPVEVAVVVVVRWKRYSGLGKMVPSFAFRLEWLSLFKVEIAIIFVLIFLSMLNVNRVIMLH